jgi:hypothetical protein
MVVLMLSTMMMIMIMMMMKVVKTELFVSTFVVMRWWLWLWLWWCDADCDYGNDDYFYEKVVIVRTMIIAVEIDQEFDSIADHDDCVGSWSVALTFY